MAEFSDVRLQLPSNAPTYHHFFPGAYVTDYLEHYIDTHVYSGQTLRHRIRFCHAVSSIEKDATGRWVVTCSPPKRTYRTAKVIIASGLTSVPYQPLLPNRDVFSGEIIHQKAFGQIAPAISSNELRHITVLGGGKSAADIVYTAVKAGKNVSWIIREHGRGPTGQGSAASAGPYANSVAAFSTRLIASLSPSIFRRKSIWDWLLHGTRAGQRLVGSIWRKVDKQNREIAGYQTREGRGEGFEKLEPDTP